MQTGQASAEKQGRASCWPIKVESAFGQQIAAEEPIVREALMFEIRAQSGDIESRLPKPKARRP